MTRGRAFRLDRNGSSRVLPWLLLAVVSLALGLLVWWTAVVAIPVAVLALVVATYQLFRRRGNESADETSTSDGDLDSSEEG